MVFKIPICMNIEYMAVKYAQMGASWSIKKENISIVTKMNHATIVTENESFMTILLKFVKS